MAQEERQETHVSQDVRFKGTVSFKESMIIDGIVEGNINSYGKLTVSKTGQIKADIKVTDLESDGLILGNIDAKGTVKLNTSAKMAGNLKAGSLKIDEGVVFEGKCDVNPNKQDLSIKV